MREPTEPLDTFRSEQTPISSGASGRRRSTALAVRLASTRVGSVALIALLTAGIASVAVDRAAAQSAPGPLRVSQANTRYFVAPSGKAVLLGGSHTWPNLVDSGTVSPPPAFDYGAYLNFLAANHHNFFRLWAQGLPKKNYSIQNAGPWYQSPQPWMRVGPG